MTFLSWAPLALVLASSTAQESPSQTPAPATAPPSTSWLSRPAPEAPLSSPSPPSPPRERRRLRLGFGLGLGFTPMPVCDGCARFDGRGLSLRLEVGWTLRPTFMLVLVERGTVVNFADQTAALIGGFTLDAVSYRTERTRVRLGAGIGFRNMDSSVASEKQTENGGMLTVGLGHDLGRAGAFALDVEASVTALLTNRSFSEVFAATMGVVWN